MRIEMETTTQPFDEWCILELLGHVKVAGRVTEEERFGIKMGRIDIPNGEGFTTQYFGGGSVYRLTPTTEEIARAVAANNQPTPVQRWELPAALRVEERPEEEYDYERDIDDEDVYDDDERLDGFHDDTVLDGPLVIPGSKIGSYPRSPGATP